MKVKYYFLTMISLMLLSFNVFALPYGTDKVCLSEPDVHNFQYGAVKISDGYYGIVHFDDFKCVYRYVSPPAGIALVKPEPVPYSGHPKVPFTYDYYGTWEPVSRDIVFDFLNLPRPLNEYPESESEPSVPADPTDSQGSSSGDSSSSDSSGSSSSSEGASSAETSPEPILPMDISGISTPYSEPVPVPEVIVNNSNIREVVDSFKRCSKISHAMPSPDHSHYNPFVTTAYNRVVDSCNAIYDEMSSLLQANEINSPLDDNHDFYTKNEYGMVIHCQRNGNNSGLYKLSKLDYPKRCSVDSDGSTRCSFTLNVNYSSGADSSYLDKICTDVYSDFSSSGDANESNDNASVDATIGADSKPTDSSVVNPTVDKGQGSGNISGDFTPPNPATGDNADVVNAINSFHYDANSKSDRLSNQIKGSQGELLNKLDSLNKQLIDVLKNNLGTGADGGHGVAGNGQGGGNTDGDGDALLQEVKSFHRDFNDSVNGNNDAVNPDYDGKESEFKIKIDDEMSGLADTVSELFDEGTSFLSDALDNIDKLIPDIKLSFDLPPAIQRGSLGRCIPIVLDFDIELVGIPNYHFHGEAVQACELYDKYIRPVLDFIMVIITFFTVRGLLVRSAEFVTDSKI